ncbi:substrate-binding periplasmic protein [Shewanella cyperi]|uniref:ABC transporter substrate-binding protein n=1 Tax=Shewanella cyperi TaxID=2814292 RepID=A0A974XMZ7_9GAMM|nr:ABC transporter substrate-binding protein [Shewanella cyperi]QSX31390.1 ABC transporter substrate-binding protein [Shewanella cyperi]QSX42178.1 ABC transporter substrate-binding protein [Shewanella cyperi]
MRLPPGLSYLLLSLLLLAGRVSAEPIKVIVGGYPFPPYVISAGEATKGLVPDLLALLNRTQKDFQFEFVPTSIENRYQAFEMHRFDLILFENPKWGWQHIANQTVALDVQDGEPYIALSRKVKDDSYFDNLADKRLVLVRGYHYSLTEFSSDEQFIKSRFLASLVPSNEAAIKAILRERGDVAPVTWSYLQYYLAQHPEQQDKLTVSQRWDQRYQHYALVHPESPIKSATLLRLLAKVQQDQAFHQLLSQYHLLSQSGNSVPVGTVAIPKQK